AGEEILNRAGIATFPYPDTAARAFQYMWRYTDNLRALYETPQLGSEEGIDAAAAKRIIDTACKSERMLLTEHESKSLLAAYGIPTVRSAIADTQAEAVQIAQGIGYPVVLKLHSETITHKTDVGGVKLNLGDTNAVKRAFDEISAIPGATGVN